MARYNKIYAGPVTEVTPQVAEHPAAAEVMPGIAVILAADEFTPAPASTNEKVFIAQDNYLAMLTVDDPYAIGERIIGMEMLDEQFFYARVPTGNDLAVGALLTTNATGEFVPAAAGNRVIATADEAYNNTSGESQLVRIRVAKGHIAVA